MDMVAVSWPQYDLQQALALLPGVLKEERGPRTVVGSTIGGIGSTMTSSSV